MNLNVRTIQCAPDRLEAFLSGDLSDAEERELNLHLNTCEHCRRTLEQQAAEPGAALSRTTQTFFRVDFAFGDDQGSMWTSPHRGL